MKKEKWYRPETKTITHLHSFFSWMMISQSLLLSDDDPAIKESETGLKVVLQVFKIAVQFVPETGNRS